MLIKIETGSYNARRYTKPWIAKITFAGSKPEYHFGDFCGDDNGGELSLEIEPGYVFARGQKDHRKPQNSAPEFFIASEDGDHKPVRLIDAKRVMDSVTK